MPQNITQEMTSGELKFALAVETVLNTIPQPEYRQLVVEALMVLTLVTEHNIVPSLGGLIAVEHLVHKANAIFLEDQVRIILRQTTIFYNYSLSELYLKNDYFFLYHVIITKLADDSRRRCDIVLRETEGAT